MSLTGVLVAVSIHQMAQLVVVGWRRSAHGNTITKPATCYQNEIAANG